MSTVLDLFNIVWANILSSSKNELTLNTLISSAISKMLAFSKEFSTEAVTELVLKYNIRSPKVLDFLKEHETLVSFLIEDAYSKIREYFPTEELVLDVLTDPETNEKILIAFIRTDLSPEDALSKLEKLDEDWWLSAASRVEKLCIHLEFV